MGQGGVQPPGQTVFKILAKSTVLFPLQICEIIFSDESVVGFVFLNNFEIQSTFKTNTMGRYYPKSMRIALQINHHLITGKPVEGTILLVNPFYPKDSVSSFGKHLLTPTLLELSRRRNLQFRRQLLQEIQLVRENAVELMLLGI